MTVKDLIKELKKLTTYWHTLDKEEVNNEWDDGCNCGYDCAAFIIEGLIENFERDNKDEED
jgi:hypothetical protein